MDTPFLAHITLKMRYILALFITLKNLYRMKRLLLHLLLVLVLTMTTQVWGQNTVNLAQPSGSGTSADPYLISSTGELFWFAGLVNGTLTDGTQQNKSAHARLTADITLNEGTFSVSRTEVTSGDTKSYNHTLSYGGKAFTGVFESGTFDSSGVQESDKPQIKWKSLDEYSGTFDGDGHYISGLYQESSDQYAGFIAKSATALAASGRGGSIMHRTPARLPPTAR